MYSLDGARPTAGGIVQASATQSTGSEVPYAKTTLAILYPHPLGRAGKARVFLIVEGLETTSTHASGLSGWVDRARRASNDGLWTAEQAPGVEHSLALDITYQELDRLVGRLEQPADRAEIRGGVSVFARVNGSALPIRGARVEELDKLIDRVQREGSPVALQWPSAMLGDRPLGAPQRALPAMQAATSTIERLPPVVPLVARR